MLRCTLKRLLMAIGWLGASFAVLAEMATLYDAASSHYVKATGLAFVGGMACASFGVAFLILFARPLGTANVVGILILFILGFWLTGAILKALSPAKHTPSYTTTRPTQPCPRVCISC
jgi:hypothetical protein